MRSYNKLLGRGTLASDCYRFLKVYSNHQPEGNTVIEAIRQRATLTETIRQRPTLTKYILAQQSHFPRQRVKSIIFRIFLTLSFCHL